MEGIYLGHWSFLMYAFTREKEVGGEAIRKTLAAPLNQKKVAQFIAENYHPEKLDFMLISGLQKSCVVVVGVFAI